jgi:hypothetical protein
MSEERIQLQVSGSGRLEDGTEFRRELTVSERVGAGGLLSETSEDRLEIGGQVCEVQGERVDGR